MNNIYADLISAISKHPKGVLRSLVRAPFAINGLFYQINSDVQAAAPSHSDNPLRNYFLEHKTGPGIWKWDHYFDIYHRFFQKFINQDVGIMEIGIYSGGSLELWRNYFGVKSRIYGIDIEDACLSYENDYTRIFIGDQGDRKFLRSIANEVRKIDIVVDDGSHVPEHQIATFEELFPHIAPGGIFICEDVHGMHNQFIDYVHGLTKGMCAMSPSNSKALIPATSLQRWVKSIQIYPYSVVIEKLEAPIENLICSRQGTEWQPFNAKSKSNA